LSDYFYEVNLRIKEINELLLDSDLNLEEKNDLDQELSILKDISVPTIRKKSIISKKENQKLNILLNRRDKILK
jgi:hypothetical protein